MDSKTKLSERAYHTSRSDSKTFFPKLYTSKTFNQIFQDLFEHKNPSPEEIFETLRSLLEAKSKREQFLEGLIEILSQVWEILTVRRFDGGRDFFKPYFRGGFVGIGKTVSHGKCGSESSSCIGDEEDDDYIESGIDATSDEMLGYRYDIISLFL